MSDKRRLLIEILAYWKRLRENRRQLQEARNEAVLAVGEAIYSMILSLKSYDSAWDDAYCSKIKRMYRRVIPRSVRDSLILYSTMERSVYGISLDGGPITELGDHRLTEKEARDLAWDMAVGLSYKHGTIVKDIRLYKRGFYLSEWVFHDAVPSMPTERGKPDKSTWTLVELGCCKEPDPNHGPISYHWTTRSPPTC